MLYTPTITRLYYAADELDRIEAHELEECRLGDVIIANHGMGEVGFVRTCPRCNTRIITKSWVAANYDLCKECRTEVQENSHE